MNVLAYLADVAILAAYAYAVKTQRQRPFHWANAFGALPLATLEVEQRLWPVLVITAAFGVIGWLGVLSDAAPNH